ncbi:hypothetical protein [Halomontanus rarus]|uniref:hypothetical protein n=1 Tax=Halomontanus rarus TaxID=3034020 RepID=UPI0023E8782A|nr:hypothetical protein [Halovivax sp. TS33]
MSEVFKLTGLHPSVVYLIHKAEELYGNVSAVANLSKDSQLKETCREQIDDFIQASAERKKQVQESDASTRPANQILALEFIAKCWKAEIKMWIKLKEEDWAGAWEELVSAQNFARWSIQANKIGRKFNMGLYEKRLLFIEKTIFPDQWFSSPGFKIGKSICSICDEDYQECDHIKGFAYNGELCTTLITDVTEADHVALVDNPASKRARIFNIAGRDTMTGLPNDQIDLEEE